MAKICLDAGHYGKYNVSPGFPEYYESERMWALHLLLRKYLEQYGFEVILTRERQEADKPLTQRGMMSTGCDLFISLHTNATVGYVMDENVDYPVAYVALNGSANDIGQKLADAVEAVMETRQEGRIATRKYDEVSNMDYYAVIRGAVSVGTPAMILEHSFHTNSKIVRWLMEDSNLDKLAQVEARVLAEYYGQLAPEIPVKSEPLAGMLTVIYSGKDGVEVHNTPDFNESSENKLLGPVGPATEKGNVFTVIAQVELPDGSRMYQLKSGLYITANEQYVTFTPAVQYESWEARIVEAKALNVRLIPNGEVIKTVYTITVIGEEADSDGDIWYKVRLGDGTEGYVWPKYLSR